MARLAADADETCALEPPPPPTAAKAAAVGEATRAADAATEACLRRATSLRPCAASSRLRRERSSDRSQTSTEAKSRCGACMSYVSPSLAEPTELADGLAR